MNLEDAQGFANESHSLTVLSFGRELPIGSSLQLFSCCYDRSHSGALGGQAGGGRELGQALDSLVSESE